MTFLAPLFVLGGLAIVGPVLFHLIRRTTREVTPFSTLMFLRPAPPRITRRSRIEHWPLLILRALVIALLAGAFARPLLTRIADLDRSAEGRRTVLLLDSSASMRREDLWQQARSRLESALRQRQNQREVAVYAFDRALHPIAGFEEWRKQTPEARVSLVLSRLEKLTPSWGGSSLGAALTGAAEAIEADSGGVPRAGEIVVIGDLQEGSRLEGLQGFPWSKSVSVTLDPLTARETGNASLQWIPPGEESDAKRAGDALRIRVTNAAESRGDQFQLRWSGQSTAPQPAYVPAGQSRIVRLKLPPGAAAGFRLELTGDQIDFDNAIHIAPPEPEKATLLFVGADAAASASQSLYFLLRAFRESPRQIVAVQQESGAAAVPTERLAAARFAVLGEDVSPAAIESLRSWVGEGRLLLAPITGAGSAKAISSLLGAAAFTAEEAKVKSYALLSRIDFSSSLFAPFADPRYSDFTKIHFWKYRRLSAESLPGARVLASFDSGDPAVIQAPLGKGSVILLASSWRPADSQLALSSKFVPMLFTLLTESGGLQARTAQYLVGDPVPLPTAAPVTSIRKPDGTEAAVSAGEPFRGTDQPGIYTALPGGWRFCVNLSPEESRLAPLPLERLTSLGVPVVTAAAAGAPGASAASLTARVAEQESQQKLWRWVILAALLLVAAESFVAARLARAPLPA